MSPLFLRRRIEYRPNKNGTPMKVLITCRLPEDILARISTRHDITGHFENSPMAPGRLRQSIADCQGLLCTISDTIDASVLDAAHHLKIIANYGVGYNNIDVEAATRRGILVTNTPGVLTNATADITMALILAVGRRIIEGDRMVREGRFRFWTPFHFLGHEISGKTLGIIGMGRIGRAVARRAAGFGMELLYHNRRRLAPEREVALEAEYTDLESLLSESDFVSLHVPLTDETRHLIGARELSFMKPGAFLINTARGPVVDEMALLAALRDGVISGAGLDVYENEPEPAPGLCELDKVVLLPHVGSATVETRYKMAAMAAENLGAGLAGRIPPNCVNRPSTTK
jgi:glyoxylate reductase